MSLAAQPTAIVAAADTSLPYSGLDSAATTKSTPMDVGAPRPPPSEPDSSSNLVQISKHQKDLLKPTMHAMRNLTNVAAGLGVGDSFILNSTLGLYPSLGLSNSSLPPEEAAALAAAAAVGSEVESEAAVAEPISNGSVVVDKSSLLSAEIIVRLFFLKEL